jgi:hypothetical protein
MELATAGLSSYACALTPSVPSNNPNTFWKTYLPTVLLIGFSLASFVGRAIPSWLTSLGPRWEQWFRSGTLVWTLMLLRIAMTVVFVLYVYQHHVFDVEINSWDTDNSMVVSWFTLVSLLGGVHTVILSIYANNQCGHNAEYDYSCMHAQKHSSPPCDIDPLVPSPHSSSSCLSNLAVCWA